MVLGSSIGRRRRKRARRKPDSGRSARRGPGRKKPARAKGDSSRSGRAGRFALNYALTALLVVGAGLGAGYLVAVMILFPVSETPIELQGVPDLRGQPLALALSELGDSGLVISRVDSIRHPLVAAGIVIGQSPLPGNTALVNGPVRVTVSSGQELRPVPDLTRLDGEQAIQLLGASGFLVEVDTVESNVAEGSVLAMDPAPGTEVALPATVRLELSKGPATFPMPDLAGWPEGDAVALLHASGLVRGTVNRRFSLLNVGRVFGQSPEPGEMVIAGTRVRLIVGRRIPWR